MVSPCAFVCHKKQQTYECACPQTRKAKYAQFRSQGLVYSMAAKSAGRRY